MRTTIALIITLLTLATVPVGAGEAGYASGESCTVAADVVTCTTTAGRGSLIVESSEPAFLKLRNALTPGWSGNLVCTGCDISAGFPGCTAVGDQVATTRKKAALSRLACLLRVIVIRQDRTAARSAADAGIDEDPDIGGGDPG